MGHRWCTLHAAGVAGLLAGLAAVAADPLQPASLDVGPLACQFRLTLEPGIRTEILGPVGSWQEAWDSPPGIQAGPTSNAAPSPVAEAVLSLAVAPLFGLRSQPSVEALSWDLLYPIMTYDRYGGESRWQLAQLVNYTTQVHSDGARSQAYTVFPLFFHRQSTDPERDYLAVWPFYGYMQKRLFRDETRFLLWPLYAQTRKKDVLTDNYMVPLVHVRRGDGLRGWQVWPLLGHEHKAITTRTNLFGEPVAVPGHDSLFALWPIYLRRDSEIGSTNPVRQRMVLPFYVGDHSPALDRDMYLWPLGLSLLDHHAEGYHQVGAPWPFIVFARGQNREVNRVFPLFSHSQLPGMDSRMWAWPIYRHQRLDMGPLQRERTRILFYLYTGATDHDTNTSQVARRTDLWPLFIARRDFAGRERFQCFALLEPILSRNTSLEQIYSPIWSIWRAEKNRRTGTSSQSLLWNLYRCDRTPTTKKCSLLFGLVRYERGPDGSRWRWLRLFKSQRPAAREATESGTSAPLKP